MQFSKEQSAEIKAMQEDAVKCDIRAVITGLKAEREAAVDPDWADNLTVLITALEEQRDFAYAVSLALEEMQKPHEKPLTTSQKAAMFGICAVTLGKLCDKHMRRYVDHSAALVTLATSRKGE